MNTDKPIGRRLRHDLRFRMLQVRRVTRLSPAMLRITLGGDELAGFVSAAADDHVRLFFPAPGERQPLRPTPTPEGMSLPDGAAKPVTRDYTPRRYDAASGELDIDFVIHDAGPATAWAQQAKPGDWLGVGGPRGSFVLEQRFDWYLLVGDETALPAIARRLEELPADARVIAVIEVGNAAEVLPLAARADVQLHWVFRHGDGARDLADTVAALPLPDGNGYAWVACETETVRRLRSLLVDERGLPKEQVKASAYWQRGAVESAEAQG